MKNPRFSATRSPSTPPIKDNRKELRHASGYRRPRRQEPVHPRPRVRMTVVFQRKLTAEHLALLPVTAVDRARTDELPAVAMMWGPADRADNGGRRHRVAADFADRWSRILGFSGPRGNDRDPLVQTRRHAEL